MQLPNGQQITPTHRGYVNWPGVPREACIAWMFPQLTRSLISVPVLADHGFVVVFRKDEVLVTYPESSPGKNDGAVLVCGPRSTTTNLWDIPIPVAPPHQHGSFADLRSAKSPPESQCSAMLAKQKTKYDLVAFVHSIFCCPPASTFLEAVRRKYIEFPGLTYQDVATHLPNVIATSYGHMKAKAYKTSEQRHPEHNADIWFPAHRAAKVTKPNERAETTLACSIIDVNDPEERADLLRHHADLTGRLPVATQSGSLYILVTYSEYSNYIHLEIVKSRTARDIVDAHSRAHNFFLQRGERGTIMRMDNEVSNELKEFFARQNPPIKMELVPPNQHRADQAERHIQSAKNHIISALANASPTFPTEKAFEFTFFGCETTLNILRASGISPYMSAYHQLHGKYDYYKNPLAPPGTRVAVHAPAETRGSWGNRAEAGWYVGPAPNHYNCVLVYMEQTNALRVAPSVEWFPDKDWELPGSSPLDVTNGLLDDLVALLKRHGAGILSAHPQASPSPPSLLKTMIDYAQTVLSQKKTPIHEIPQTALEQRVQDPSTAPSTSVASLPPPSPPAPAPPAQPAPPPSETGAQVPPAPPSDSAEPPAAGSRRRQARISTTPMPPNVQRVQKTTKTSASSLRRNRRKANLPTKPPASILRRKASPPAPGLLPVMQKDAPSPPPASPNFVETPAAPAVNKKAQSPLRRGTKSAKAIKHPVGTRVTKFFNDGGLWTGIVSEINKTRPNIRLIEYRDGDKEHMHINEIDALHRLYNRPDDFADCAIELIPPGSLHVANHPAHFAGAAVTIDGVITPANYTSALSGPDSIPWTEASCTEFDKLLGGGDPVMNGTHLKDIKKGHLIARDCPQLKVKPAATPGGVPNRRVRLTLDGSSLTNITDRSSPTADLETIKIMCNHAVSTPGSKIATADCADYYLGSPFPDGRKEYMFLKLSHVPSAIIAKYNLTPFITTRGKTEGIYVQVNKGMYGIPDSGRLAKDRLDILLDGAGFYQTPSTPCLYRHKTRKICFSLIVDDFFIVHTKDEDRDYLFETLRTMYTLKTNTAQTLKYVGITISKDDKARQLSLSAPGYIRDILLRFDRPAVPVRRTHTPAPFTAPHYGSKEQLTDAEDTSRKLSAPETSRLQAIVGCLMWYSRAVDPTMLHALSKIGSQQAHPTEKVLNAAHHLLDYAATYPDAKIVYVPSSMKLVTHSDASYLCESGARSRASNI